MPATVRYTTIKGEIIAEKRNGVRSLYVPDPLGSTVALLDNTQTQTDQWSYMPYGETTRIKGSNPTPFLFGGTLGMRADSTARTYARARIVEPSVGRWMTEDPFWGINRLYSYALNNPKSYIDPSGQSPETWTPPWLGPGGPNRGKILKCLSDALKSNPDCAKTGHDLAELYAIMRCIMGCENRDEPGRTDPFKRDYDPDYPGQHKQLPPSRAGTGPCRIVGRFWPDLTGQFPGWDNQLCDNIKVGVAILCKGGDLNRDPWNTYRNKVERDRCYKPCMDAIYNPPKPAGVKVT